jgi:hypothetical protein
MSYTLNAKPSTPAIATERGIILPPRTMPRTTSYRDENVAAKMRAARDREFELRCYIFSRERTRAVVAADRQMLYWFGGLLVLGLLAFIFWA